MISIILPVYNVESFLDKCLKSILNQTFKDFELIIVNDGSTDASYEICKKYAKDNKKINLINQENKGVSEARNTGLRHATKNLITFIDSDDWVEKEMLETLYNLYKKENADISICEYSFDKKEKIKYRFNNKKITSYNAAKALSILIEDKYINNYLWGKLYNKRVLNKIEFPKNKYYEDIFVMYKIFNNASKIVKIDSALYHYVQHEKSITSPVNKDLKKDLGYHEALMSQFNFVIKNTSKVYNYKKAITNIAKKIYKSKKQIIYMSDINSNAFKEINEIITPDLITVFKEIDIFRFGALTYLKFYIAIYKPSLLLKYLNATRKKSKIITYR